MNEKLIEAKLGREVKKLKGIALKLHCPWFTGMPDRLVLMPGGRVYFAELKSTGKQLKPRQVVVIDILRKMGFDVFVIDTQEQLNEFIKHIKP